MAAKKTEGVSNLEHGLLAENSRLFEENKFLKALIQDNAQHYIEVDGDDWYCMCCGERAELSVETSAFPHKDTCVLNKKQKV